MDFITSDMCGDPIKEYPSSPAHGIGAIDAYSHLQFLRNVISLDPSAIISIRLEPLGSLLRLSLSTGAL